MNVARVIEANKFNEVQKYLAGTRHIYNPQTMIALASLKRRNRLRKAGLRRDRQDSREIT